MTLRPHIMPLLVIQWYMGLGYQGYRAISYVEGEVDSGWCCGKGGKIIMQEGKSLPSIC